MTPGERLTALQQSHELPFALARDCSRAVEDALADQIHILGGAKQLANVGAVHDRACASSSKTRSMSVLL
jgi:hypothetical protein